MIHAPPLKELADIEHGFGTAADGAWVTDEAHAWLKQIHSGKIVRSKSSGLQGEADALITTAPELWVSVRTADCLPILLADAEARIVAAVHAGWRGTVEQIAAETVQQMVELGAHLSSIRAAIGPGIGLCCFEVGPEVSPHFGAEGKTCVDLAEANERQLLDSGLDLDNIWISKQCTKCNPDLFHSYRRDAESAGRMVSAIRII
jgi:YfiH family protein